MPPYVEQHVQNDVQEPQDGEDRAEEAADQLQPRHEWVVVLPVGAISNGVTP